MNFKKFYFFAIFTIFLIGCDKLIEPKDKGLVEIKAIEQRWLDGYQVALVSSRITLGPQIGNLQAIKRDLENIVVSECLKKAKAALGESMQLSIDGLLKFMAKYPKYQAEILIDKGKEKLATYKEAKEECSK